MLLQNFKKKKRIRCQLVSKLSHHLRSLWFPSKSTTTEEEKKLIIILMHGDWGGARDSKRKREREGGREERGLSYEIVFFSVTLDSGRARLSTFKRAVVLARIRECKYACIGNASTMVR